MVRLYGLNDLCQTYIYSRTRMAQAKGVWREMIKCALVNTSQLSEWPQIIHFDALQASDAVDNSVRFITILQIFMLLWSIFTISADFLSFPSSFYRSFITLVFQFCFYSQLLFSFLHFKVPNFYDLFSFSNFYHDCT